VVPVVLVVLVVLVALVVLVVLVAEVLVLVLVLLVLAWALWVNGACGRTGAGFGVDAGAGAVGAVSAFGALAASERQTFIRHRAHGIWHMARGMCRCLSRGVLNGGPRPTAQGNTEEADEYVSEHGEQTRERQTEPERRGRDTEPE
jgi:hypothetical protein